ncbi:MAG: MBOAT family protein [Ruminococcus sp.]|nr:MBOAT family protein [Ruminococcus sp.]
MVFSSAAFIYIFLPVVFIVCSCIPGMRGKNYFLLAADLVFLAFGDPAALLVMLCSTAFNYAAGRLMASGKYRRLALAACVVINLGVLFVYKYLGYILSLAGLWKAASEDFLRLPLGISFFTFQAMSYVIDCYRDKSLIRKNFAELALYISFFPQLIAGPIIRYGDISGQLNGRKHTAEKTASGIRRFCFGLGKKMLIANSAARAADYVFSYDPSELTALAAWAGAVCYALQIYYDFGGYSDMAIGLGKMFGFDFEENFNYPYSAVSLTDFWRRWHISLSRWFRDYLYIPLGGSRRGKLRTVLNKWAVFICTGIWHGANLTFLVWGMFHGFLLTVESIFDKKGKRPLLSPLRRIVTLGAVIISFAIFRSDSLSYAVGFIGKMFSDVTARLPVNAGLSLIFTPLFITQMAAGIIFSAPIVPAAGKFIGEKFGEKAEYISYIPALGVFILSLLTLSEGGYDPFIYFRF